VRHQNPDKSNNFFKQNVFNEKLNITKNPFTWHLGDPCKAIIRYIPHYAWMMASILDLKRSQARCNVALSMPTNAASIAASLMTSHWDAETCLWPFQLRSLYSSLKDLNGLLGGQNGSRDEQFGLSWQSQRASVVSLMCTICIEGPPWQFDARMLDVSLIPTIDANFRNDYPGSSEISAWALSTGILAVRFFEWFFLASILEPSLGCSKVVYFATTS